MPVPDVTFTSSASSSTCAWSAHRDRLGVADHPDVVVDGARGVVLVARLEVQQVAAQRRRELGRVVGDEQRPPRAAGRQRGGRAGVRGTLGVREHEPVPGVVDVPAEVAVRKRANSIAFVTGSDSPTRSTLAARPSRARSRASSEIAESRPEDVDGRRPCSALIASRVGSGTESALREQHRVAAASGPGGGRHREGRVVGARDDDVLGVVAGRAGLAQPLDLGGQLGRVLALDVDRPQALGLGRVADAEDLLVLGLGRPASVPARPGRWSVSSGTSPPSLKSIGARDRAARPATRRRWRLASPRHVHERDGRRPLEAARRRDRWQARPRPRWRRGRRLRSGSCSWWRRPGTRGPRPRRRRPRPAGPPPAARRRAPRARPRSAVSRRASRRRPRSDHDAEARSRQPPPGRCARSQWPTDVKSVADPSQHARTS